MPHRIPLVLIPLLAVGLLVADCAMTIDGGVAASRARAIRAARIELQEFPR